MKPLTIEQCDSLIVGVDGTAPEITPDGFRTTANSREAADRICRRCYARGLDYRVYGLFIYIAR